MTCAAEDTEPPAEDSTGTAAAFAVAAAAVNAESVTADASLPAELPQRPQAGEPMPADVVATAAAGPGLAAAAAVASAALTACDRENAQLAAALANATGSMEGLSAPPAGLAAAAGISESPIAATIAAPPPSAHAAGKTANDAPSPDAPRAPSSPQPTSSSAQGAQQTSTAVAAAAAAAAAPAAPKLPPSSGPTADAAAAATAMFPAEAPLGRRPSAELTTGGAGGHPDSDWVESEQKAGPVVGAAPAAGVVSSSPASRPTSTVTPPVAPPPWEQQQSVSAAGQVLAPPTKPLEDAVAAAQTAAAATTARDGGADAAECLRKGLKPAGLEPASGPTRPGSSAGCAPSWMEDGEERDEEGEDSVQEPTPERPLPDATAAADISPAGVATGESAAIAAAPPPPSPPPPLPPPSPPGATAGECGAAIDSGAGSGADGAEPARLTEAGEGPESPRACGHDPPGDELEPDGLSEALAPLDDPAAGGRMQIAGTPDEAVDPAPATSAGSVTGLGGCAAAAGPGSEGAAAPAAPEGLALTGAAMAPVPLVVVVDAAESTPDPDRGDPWAPPDPDRGDSVAAVGGPVPVEDAAGRGSCGAVLGSRAREDAEAAGCISPRVDGSPEIGGGDGVSEAVDATALGYEPDPQVGLGVEAAGQQNEADAAAAAAAAAAAGADGAHEYVRYGMALGEEVPAGTGVSGTDAAAEPASAACATPAPAAEAAVESAGGMRVMLAEPESPVAAEALAAAARALVIGPPQRAAASSLVVAGKSAATSPTAATAPPQPRGGQGSSSPRASSVASFAGRAISQPQPQPQAVARRGAVPSGLPRAPAGGFGTSTGGGGDGGGRDSSGVEAPAAPDVPPKPHKGSAARVTPVHNDAPQQQSGKPRSYAQLYSARGADASSGGVGAPPAAAPADVTVAPALPPGEDEASAHIGAVSQGDRPAAEEPPKPGGSGGGGGDGRGGSAARFRHCARTVFDEELGLIAQVEAEAVQLGLQIYARGGAGGSPGGTAPRRPAVEGFGAAQGDGKEQDEEEEPLEAIMALGRRPSEIAELLLGGAGAAAAAVDAPPGAYGGGGGDEEARRRRRQAAKERKRALRQQQRRQQRQRQRALMGLDSQVEAGDSGGESCSSPSSSSAYSSGGSSSGGRRRSSIIGFDGGSASWEGHEHGGGGGGEIRTLDSRGLLLLSAVASAGTAPEAVAPEFRDDDGDPGPGVEGRILVSAGAAAVLGLLLFTADDVGSAATAAVGAPPPPASPPQRRGADGDVGVDVSDRDRGRSRDASGFVPSYLLDTPPPEPRVSNGMAFQPRPGSDYAPSIAPTMATSSTSTLPWTADSSFGGDGGGRRGSRATVSAAAATAAAAGGSSGGVYDDDEQFLAARDERSRKIAEQLAALQEESRLLQQQSALLQERTREISRSVGLTTPPQFTAGAAATPRPPLPPPPLSGSSGGDAQASGRGSGGGDAGAAAHAAMAADALPPLRYRVQSPAAAVAAPGAAATLPLESRAEGDVDSQGGASCRRQPAPISWTLPGRNAKAAAAAPPPPRAFPSPPKGSRRLQALAQPSLTRTGSASSLVDVALPLWAEQVESPVMTPQGPQPQSVRVLPPIEAADFPAAAAAAAGGGAAAAAGGRHQAGPPPPLVQHVTKGRPGGISRTPAVAKGQLQAKSRLGAAAEQPSGAQLPLRLTPSQAKAAAKSKVQQPQSQQQPQQLGSSPGPLPPPLLALKPQHHGLAGPGQQPQLPAEWTAAAAGPLGLPQALLMPPPLASLPLPPGLMLPPFQGMAAGPAATAAAAAGPNSVPIPAVGNAAAAVKRQPGSKGPTRPSQPSKVPAASSNGGTSPRGEAGSRAAVDAGPGRSMGPGDSYGGGRGGVEGVPLPPPPPPWLLGLGPGPGLPLAPQGMLPVVLPPPYGVGVPEQMGPVGPWMTLPHEMPEFADGAAVPAGAGTGGGGGGGGAPKGSNVPATASAASSGAGKERKDRGVRPGPSRIPPHGPAKHTGDHDGAAAKTATAAAAVPEEQSYMGQKMPFGLPGGGMGPAGIMGCRGMPGGLMAPAMHNGSGGGAGDGGRGLGNGLGGGMFHAYSNSNDSTPLIPCDSALPPVKLQPGKGTMSRSAPPGSYSAGAGVGLDGSPGCGVVGPLAGFEGLGFGLPVGLWPAPAMYGIFPGPQYLYGGGGMIGAGAVSPSSEAAAIARRANEVQEQQMERYRELESNLMNKLDRQNEQSGLGGRIRDRRRNSHDGRPVFRLF